MLFLFTTEFPPCSAPHLKYFRPFSFPVSLGGIQGFEQNLCIIIPYMSLSLTDNIGFLLMAQLIPAEQLDLLNFNQNFLYGRLKWSS